MLILLFYISYYFSYHYYYLNTPAIPINTNSNIITTAINTLFSLLFLYFISLLFKILTPITNNNLSMPQMGLRGLF